MSFLYTDDFKTRLTDFEQDWISWRMQLMLMQIPTYRAIRGMGINNRFSVDRALLDDASVIRDGKTGEIKAISFKNSDFDLDVQQFSYRDLTYGNSAWVRYFLEDHIELMVYKKGFVYSIEELEEFVRTGESYLDFSHPQKKMELENLKNRPNRFDPKAAEKEKAAKAKKKFKGKEFLLKAKDPKKKTKDQMESSEFAALWNSPPKSLLNSSIDGYSSLKRQMSQEEYTSPTTMKEAVVMSANKAALIESKSATKIPAQRRTFHTTSGFGRDRNIFGGSNKRSFLINH